MITNYHSQLHNTWQHSETSYPNHEFSVSRFNLVVVCADVSTVDSNRSFHVIRL